MPVHFTQRITLFILLLYSIGNCQPPTTEEKVRESIVIYQAGEAGKAIKMMQKICRDEPHHLFAHQTLGQFYIEQRQWDNALLLMDHVLKIDKNNLDAQIIMAQAYRAKGYFSSFVIRTRFWKNSEKYFQAVLAADSTMKNVLYEYSILKGYQEKYQQAIELLQHHLKFFPDDLDAYYKVYFYYDALIFRGNKNDVKLLQRPDELSRYFLGEYYRQKGKLEKAESIFNSLNSPPFISPCAILLSQAKLAFQQNMYKKAELYYNDAIEAISNEKDATILFHDIKYIFSDAELRYLKNLNYLQAKNYIKKSWLRRNPFPSSSYNARLIEHLKRCDYAEKNHRQVKIGKTRWQAVDAVFECPDIYDMADRYDDQGVIYIRYGPPNEKSRVCGGNATVEAGKWWEGLDSGESWFYYQTESTPAKIFHFIKTRMESQITPILPDKMLVDCMGWDKKYFRLLTSSDDREKHQLQEMLELENEKVIYEGLNSDYYQWNEQEKNINVSCYLAGFARDEKKSNYELYYSLCSQFIATIPDTLDMETELNIGLGVFDENWNTVIQKNRVVSLDEIKTWIDSLGYWPGQLNFSLHNGQSYFTSLSLQIPTMDKMGGFKIKIASENDFNDKPFMSDLEPAGQITKTDESGQFIKNNLKVLPKPDLKYGLNNPLHLYFELYNLPMSEKKNVEYDIIYQIKSLGKLKKSFMDKLTGLFFSNDKKLSIAVQGFAAQKNTCEYMALDLSKLDPGLYNLEVSVTAQEYNLTLNKDFNFVLQ